MKRDQLLTLLGSLSGHLVTASPKEEKQVEALNRFILRSLLPEDRQMLKGRSFAFENADLFSETSIPPRRLDGLRSLLAKETRAHKEAEFRVFVREVPVRSTQIHSSVPAWAGGAAVDRTIGPFLNKDGRQFWFDFFRIEKLVALYIQNQPTPALLFKVSSGMQFIDSHLPLIAPRSKSYRLPPGSIWINSQLLAANAPSGNFTGLTISGGLITLSAPPKTIDGKLTIAGTTVVTVELDLQQPDVTDADPSSPYGVDARDGSLQLPEKFSFRFTNSTSDVNEVSGARWKIFGHSARFEWDRQGVTLYDNSVARVLIPFDCSEPAFAPESTSPFHTVRGHSQIKRSAWALPTAPIDVLNPTPASGIGGMLIQCEKGLSNTWQGLQDGEISLTQPYLIADPGRISISDPSAANSFAHQAFALWKDERNSYGTSVTVNYPQTTPFSYFTFANGNEALMVLGHADVKIDRPVTVSGEPVRLHSKNSVLTLGATKSARLLSLFDDNILADSSDLATKPPSFPKPIAIALRNALFKVTPANGCVLFGRLAGDFVKVTDGFLYLTFGMHAYIPTLPDPYAANLGILRNQFREHRSGRLTESFSPQQIWMWLASQVKWQPTNIPNNDPDDKVEVSFHFAPLQNQFQVTLESSYPEAPSEGTANAFSSNTHPLAALSRSQAEIAVRENQDAGPLNVAAEVRIQGEVEEGDRESESKDEPLPDYGAIWDESTQHLQQDAFALLDVSSNADLLGISFGTFGDRRMMMVKTHAVATSEQSAPGGFPLQVKGMDVVSEGINVRAFTVPPISWEPAFNLTPHEVKGDPTVGFNYYPDDGGPARVLNNSTEQVALAPLPVTDFLVDSFANENKFAAIALFTLPFGLRALALLKKEFEADGVNQKGTNLLLPTKSFEDNLKTARLLELEAGESPVQGESNMFVGCTVQVNNVQELDGSQQGNSTLGRSVTKIFNREFMPKTPGDVLRPRGVPLTRIDLSGYGASTFSNWLNPKATIAATSQTRFDVLLGRCAHEIIQVRSIMYPWGVRVVRTITLFRGPTNYVFRHDSGWKAESHGKFDFSYYANEQPKPNGKLIPVPRPTPYEIHPGVVKGIFNVTEIKETRDIKPFSGNLTFKAGEPYIDEDNGMEKSFPGPNVPKEYELQPVYFNAEVEIENPVSGYITKEVDGQEKKLVPSKRVLGFVQLAPRGMPIPIITFQALIASQQGSIGGLLDCLINIADSDQEIRLNRFDVNNSVGLNGIDPVFVVAGRGNVILPKEGSWSLVKHENGTGSVTPVPQDLSVPLIRTGKLQKPKGSIFTPPTFDLVEIDKRIKADGDLVLEPKPAKELIRIANPSEILRSPVPTTINYGFLHSTDTQKALFLTPAFGQGVKMLLSKTPPLFADAFRLVSSKAIFPNIKDAVSSFGEAIPLIKDKDSLADQFKVNGTFADGGKNVMELMQINPLGKQGYKLLKEFPSFPLPDHWDLVSVGGAFRIYIEYKTSQASEGAGKLNYDVDSVADAWESRMSNVALVVDLGPIDRLMTIKGNWDAKKGSEASFGGGGAGEVPRPQIEFSDKLKPVMDILEILQSLSGEDYAETVGKGVRLAMSNKAGSWDYKFEASKEIPLLRFPPIPELYKNPNTPLKLEAGLKLGAYFNSALMVTNDAKQLLPSAGGFLGFYGRLSVMCVSLSAVTVYAVGQANLDFGADTKTGPFLRMKFGFGAQIVVGLPVIANVSVLYVVGVEIYLDSKNLNVGAFLMFSGHADVLSGLVSVTIMIEAKGMVGRNELEKKTNLVAQVTFGLDITIAWVIDISFEESWEETRQIAGEVPV